MSLASHRSALQLKLRHLYDRLRQDDQSLTHDEKEFCSAWVKRHLSDLSPAAVTLAATVLGLSLLPIALLAPEPPRNIQILTHALLGILLMAWRYFRAKGHPRTWIFLLIIAVSTAGYAVAIRETLTMGITVKDVLILTSIYSTVLTVGIILFPVAGPWVFVMDLYHFVTTLCIFVGTQSTAELLVPWLATTSVQIAFSTVIFYGRLKRIQNEGLHEYRERSLMASHEKLRREALEKDMILAQEIQNSFSPPQNLVESYMKINFFQQKHTHLGGDWCAMKKSPTGEISILIADATGKSVSAALVIHAVQSLWALALDDDPFDPVAWMFGVNKSLCALGQKSIHSLTLGLAQIKGSTLTYHSAGHVPAVVFLRNQGERSLKFLHARGDIMGLRPEIHLVPVTINLEKERVKTLVLTTDGVLDKGTRTDRKFLTQLLQSLDAVGEKALDQCQTEDDKLLIRLELLESSS